ncbi:protein translocase subunit SecD, partial [Patescibacteria group bacterium]|nr:protein translocase subunit SecD [Patescibacteria group bacterium]
MKTRISAIILLALAVFIALFALKTEDTKFPYKFGLDIAGGTHLVYKADVSDLNTNEIKDSMDSLRDVIERRTNLFGVSEPLVQTEKSSSEESSKEQRLIVELPGVTDINIAVEMIGQTPLLEFKLAREITGDTEESMVQFESTGITGRMIEKAQLQFNSTSGEPIVLLSFNNEGKDLFAKVTKENIGEILAIFLDNAPISTPIIQDEIKDGKAQISGGFTPQEAKLLVRDINYGALPVPIELISTQTIGASIGEDTLTKGITAGLYGLLTVIIFLILWYRLPGLLASISLIIYISVLMTVFKLIPVTLTSAGIAGFILSIGMAVDANVLIFERIKEELKEGRDIASAISEGFTRAWLSIRDSNISSIITAVILFW